MYVIPFSTDPDLFLLSVMLSKTSGMEIWKANRGELPLAEYVSLNDYSIQEVAKTYKRRFGAFHETCFDLNAKYRLNRALFWALRHPKANLAIVTETVEISFKRGIPFALSKATEAGARFLEYATQTYREYDRLRGFARLEEREEGELIGAVETEFDVIDILIRFFERRYPGYRVALQNGDALYLSDTAETVSVVESVAKTNMPLKKLFSVYYDTQYIEERKNIALMRRSIPKKYWRWIEDGKKLEDAARENG